MRGGELIAEYLINERAPYVFGSATTASWASWTPSANARTEST